MNDDPKNKQIIVNGDFVFSIDHDCIKDMPDSSIDMFDIGLLLGHCIACEKCKLID